MSVETVVTENLNNLDVWKEDEPNIPVCDESRDVLRVDERRSVAAEAVPVTSSNPPLEDVDEEDGESPGDLLLTNLFIETSNECLQLSTYSVVVKGFAKL